MESSQFDKIQESIIQQLIAEGESLDAIKFPNVEQFPAIDFEKKKKRNDCSESKKLKAKPIYDLQKLTQRQKHVRSFVECCIRSMKGRTDQPNFYRCSERDGLKQNFFKERASVIKPKEGSYSYQSCLMRPNKMCMRSNQKQKNEGRSQSLNRQGDDLYQAKIKEMKSNGKRYTLETQKKMLKFAKMTFNLYDSKGEMTNNKYLEVCQQKFDVREDLNSRIQRIKQYEKLKMSLSKQFYPKRNSEKENRETGNHKKKQEDFKQFNHLQKFRIQTQSNSACTINVQYILKLKELNSKIKEKAKVDAHIKKQAISVQFQRGQKDKSFGGLSTKDGFQSNGQFQKKDEFVTKNRSSSSQNKTDVCSRSTKNDGSVSIQNEQKLPLLKIQQSISGSMIKNQNQDYF